MMNINMSRMNLNKDLYVRNIDSFCIADYWIKEE